MALSDSTQADRPYSAVCCMVCLSGFVKQCSLNVDSLMDFISGCLLAEGSNLPPPGLAQMSSDVAVRRTTLILSELFQELHLELRNKSRHLLCLHIHSTLWAMAGGHMCPSH